MEHENLLPWEKDVIKMKISNHMKKIKAAKPGKTKKQLKKSKVFFP